jgi:hypothetical protein
MQGDRRIYLFGWIVLVLIVITGSIIVWNRFGRHEGRDPVRDKAISSMKTPNRDRRDGSTESLPLTHDKTDSESVPPVASPADKILKNLNNSGIDVYLSSTKGILTMIFSEPVSFASLKISGNTLDVSLKAYDPWDNLLDMDVDTSEFYVFGGNILKIVLEGAKGTVKELNFLPQKD